eukprot:gene16625-22872_t
MMELMQQQQQQQQGGGQPGGGMPSAEDMQQEEEKRRNADDQRRSMLVAITTPEARERLNRIAIVKPDKARAVEAMIIQAAQRGQLNEKVSDERLMSMLEQINEREGGTKSKVTIQRKRPNMDDDADW